MGLKKKNYMIILMNAKKACDKIQHSFMQKTIQRAVSEEPYLNTMKVL